MAKEMVMCNACSGLKRILTGVKFSIIDWKTYAILCTCPRCKGTGLILADIFNPTNLTDEEKATIEAAKKNAEEIPSSSEE